jgi:hypothetical protein
VGALLKRAVSACAQSRRSITVEMPMPAPMHWVARP